MPSWSPCSAASSKRRNAFFSSFSTSQPLEHEVEEDAVPEFLRLEGELALAAAEQRADAGGDGDLLGAQGVRGGLGLQLVAAGVDQHELVARVAGAQLVEQVELEVDESLAGAGLVADAQDGGVGRT